MTLVTVAIGGLSLLSGISGANAAKQEARSSAEFDLFQANQDEIQKQRDLRDEAAANAKTSARTRAVLAAQGVDLTDTTALSLVADVNTESAIRAGRITADSNTRQASLRTRANNTLAAGRAAQTNSLIGGVTRGLKSLLG